jgi:methylmalonyl-CoA mutase
MGVDTGSVDGAALEAEAPEPPEELALASVFPEPTRAEWEALVDGVLRKTGRISDDAPLGTGVEKLVWSTPDGIRVRPLYTADDVAELPATGVPGLQPFVRGPRAAGSGGWDVRQRFAGRDARVVREAVLDGLEGGVTSVWLVAGAGGVPVSQLPSALDGVLLDLAPVVLDAGADSDGAANQFLELAADRGVAKDALRGNLGIDPLGLRARFGSGPDTGSILRMTAKVAGEYPNLRALVVDGRPVHDAGGSDAQELGYLLSAGVAYLRTIINAATTPDIDIDRAARLVELRVVATADQFPTIAKMRAIRRLWARVLEACGAGERSMSPVHAVTSSTMFTRRDPYVNLLRGTVACFAAGVGGADSITVAPFDAAIGISTPFSRRIARNTQALLMEESHLARVIDPAGGSWYVESLTDGLANAAWRFFQEVEAEGGAAAVLESGYLAERIATVRSAHEKAVATRRVPITGVSEFPDLDEKPVEREPWPALRTHGALPVYRPAAPYEEFRDRSDAELARTGSRPRAFLATLGPLAAYTARAGFTRNLLQAGGVEAVEAGPTETADDVVAAFREAGTPVAVLCSTDALYEERAAATAAALRAAGARTVLLAGKAQVDGVDATLAAGGDALATIGSVYEALEKAR